MNPFVIKKPIITEKTLTQANEKNVYTFLVNRGSSKTAIKEAIEQLYKVDVVAVNTVTNQTETKKTGKKRQEVTVPKKKKAMVKIKDGQTIELFDITE